MKTKMRIVILAMAVILFAIACQNSFLSDAQTQSTTGVSSKAPSVSITSPSNGATFSTGADISVSVNASDGSGIDSVTFWHITNGSWIWFGKDTSSPYQNTWSEATDGTHEIRVRATANDGTTKDASIDITVGGSSSDWLRIQCKASDDVLVSWNTNDREDITVAGSGENSDNAYWKKVDTGDGYFRLENKATGMWFRPDSTTDKSYIEQVDTGYTGDWPRWKTIDTGDGYFRLQNKWSGMWMRPESSTNGSKVWHVTTSYTGDWPRWRFVSDGSTPTPTPTPVAGGITKVGQNFWNYGWGEGWEDYINSGINWSTVTNPWRSTFLNELAGYDVLRMMDWSCTNNSAVVNWSERIQKTDNHYSWDGGTNTLPVRGNDGVLKNSYGVAYEWMIDLCNRKDADIWVTIPHKANWDYSYQLAQLLNNNLESARKIYVEYSNETWNGGFSQFQYCIDQGEALNLPGMNEWYKGRAYHVYAAVRHFKEFERVFGTGSSRLIKVLAGQSADESHARHHVTVLEDSTVNPDNITVNAYAIAPYVGGNSVADLSNDISNKVADGNSHLDELDGTGISLIAYEGGQHCTSGADTVNRNSGMSGLYIDYFDAMDTVMQGAFVHYTHTGTFSSGGAWGSKEYTGQSDSSAHKYRAIKDWINSNL